MVTAAGNHAKRTGTNVFSDKEWPYRVCCERSCFQGNCRGSCSSFSEASWNSVIRCNEWYVVISSDTIDSCWFSFDRALVPNHRVCRFERSQEMFCSITVHSLWQWTTHIVCTGCLLSFDFYNRGWMVFLFDGWEFILNHCWTLWWNEWSLYFTMSFRFDESISLSEPTNTSQHCSLAFTSNWRRRCLTEFIDRTWFWICRILAI
jgi:hypothetical protein